MSILNQTDINARLQLTGCKFSDLVNTYANDLKWGRKCNNIEKILLLNAYIEILECYKVDLVSSSVLSTATYGGSYGVGTFTFLTNNGITTGPITINNSGNLSTFVTDFNIANPGYSVIGTPNGQSEFILNFSGPCTNGTINIIYTGQRGSSTLVTLTGGVCSTITVYNNCLSETQIQSILDNISKLTKICFEPIGYTY